MASQPEPVGNEVIATDLPLIFKVCLNSLKKKTKPTIYLPVIMSSTLTFATLFIITFNLLNKI